MTDIFVSRPNWIHQKYQAGIDNFMRSLDLLQLKPRTLGTTDYPTKSPLDEVINIMNQCSGAIILGYPQIEIKQGLIKNSRANGIVLGTEWNHIETALAYSLNIPILVIKDASVSRGVFERGALNTFIHSVEFENEHWDSDIGINGALKKWKSEISPEKKRLKSSYNGPICPVCGSFANPIPKDFVAIEGANHECPACKWKGMI